MSCEESQEAGRRKTGRQGCGAKQPMEAGKGHTHLSARAVAAGPAFVLVSSVSLQDPAASRAFPLGAITQHPSPLRAPMGWIQDFKGQMQASEIEKLCLAQHKGAKMSLAPFKKQTQGLGI